jgi:hypothetical protein
MILKIGSEHLSADEYAKSLIPLITRLFSLPDRGIRLILLEHLSSFVDKLDNRTVQDRLFNDIASPYILDWLLSMNSDLSATGIRIQRCIRRSP